MTQALPASMLHVLHDQAARLGDRPALWSKRAGYYLPLSWRDLAAQVRHFALGLRRLGFGKGEVLLIASGNREEWVVAFLAGMALGGRPMAMPWGVDPHALAGAVRRFSAKIAVVERTDGALPGAGAVVSLEPRPSTDPGHVSFAEVLQSGMGRDEGPYWESVNGLQPDEVAALACTSGATSPPKAVMLSHRNLVWTSRALADAAGLQDGDVALCHQPLAHVAEQLVSVHLGLTVGLQVYFAQGGRPLWDELHEVRPSVLHATPRAYQRLLRHLEGQAQGASAARRAAVAWARGVALRRNLLAVSHDRVSPRLQVQYELATRGVLHRIKQEVGLQRAKLLLTSGEPMDRALLESFASFDLLVNEAYGAAESSGLVSLGTAEAMKLGACGRPLLGVEVKISGDEVLFRGPNACLGYHGEASATPAIARDGWVHTGDAGQLDPDGYLRIAGRTDELLQTTGAKKVAPAAVEWMLTRLSPVQDAVVMRSASGAFGAVLTLDPDRTYQVARARGWPVEPQRLSEHSGFLEDLQRRIDAEVNLRLSRWEAVKAVVVLPGPLSIEGGDLTGNWKLRRRELQRRHGPSVEASFPQPRRSRET